MTGAAPRGARAGDSGAPALLGTAPAFEAFRDALERVAAAEATVLLEGEPGTGKSLAAAALHAASPRAGGPLVTLDLAALAPTLLEAELFGHEEGAFTGAQGAREGRLRRARGGTLVLEGIEDLPLALQPKLLRALQERVVEPLGGEGSVPIDVRLVATSGVDLQARVRQGSFREDLYYRLAVVPLVVPPLRARAEDVPLLATALAVRAAARLGVPPRELSPAALGRLALHPWPGNVRELENAIERVLVLEPGGGPVAAEELDFLEEARLPASELARAALAQGLTLDALALALIEAALDEERGNASAAARRLGLTRRALDYRRRKLEKSPATPEGSDSSGDDEEESQ